MLNLELKVDADWSYLKARICFTRIVFVARRYLQPYLHCVTPFQFIFFIEDRATEK